MNINQLLENKKGVMAPKRVTKPRNFVAKNAIGSGAGAHKDKKKAAKQGDVKHKGKELSESLTPLTDVQKLQQDCAELFKYKVGMRPTWDMLQELGMTKDKWEDEEMLHLFMQRLNSWEDNPQVMEDEEYDDEAGMADNNLETLKRSVAGIDELIQPEDNLPEWCQEKIAVANSMLVTVWDYMLSEKEREQGVEEGMYRRPGSPTAYDRDYRSSVSGMGKHDSLAYQQDGGANDEGWGDEPYQHKDDKPVLKGYYFYDVPAGKENLAAIYGVKKTKSGKWAKAVYSTSGRSYALQKNGADKEFGPGKFWSPNK